MNIFFRLKALFNSGKQYGIVIEEGGVMEVFVQDGWVYVLRPLIKEALDG